MKVKVLRGRIPDGYRPQRQTFRRADVAGVSEWTRRMAYGQYKVSSGIHIQVFFAILKNPGLTLTGVARKLSLSANTVMSALSGMDVHGLLLYENGYGQLYPFGTGGIEDMNSETVPQQLGDVELASMEHFRAAVQMLPSHQVEVLELLYDRHGNPQKTMREVASDLGIARWQVKQIRNEAFLRLRFRHKGRLEFLADKGQCIQVGNYVVRFVHPSELP